MAVHLLFLGGYSHLVVAYWLGRAWARRYSIVLPDPSTGEATEFAFAFGFFGPFDEYCRAVPLMDRVVESLSWPDDGFLDEALNSTQLKSASGPRSAKGR